MTWDRWEETRDMVENDKENGRYILGEMLRELEV